MEQIAEECSVGLVAYTMTHHTRQSAMGLPEICTRGIEGKMVHTTEYTMSEIIASIYDCMEQTGKKRGILFLDEINCVSETLAPVMLQLLQDKKFGNQHIPDDWLIVAAGNPPEYNKSVREFDVATLDRVRKIEVLPELSVWLSYAEKNQIHSAVTTYLMAHSDHFYSVSQEADEKRFVTARGWEDLSAVLKSYEILHFPVDEALIGQYLQEEKTAEEVARMFKASGAQRLVMGFPRNMDGTEGPRAALYRDFAALLERTVGIKPVLWDERRTTIEAHQILNESNYHGKKRKNTVDAVAASLILEGYLAYFRNQKE